MAEKVLPAREFVRAVRGYSLSHGLLSAGDGVLAGVSGGPDSVALLLVLRELSRPLKLRLRVAHLDHGMRGDSAGDGAFVRALSLRLGIPVSQARVDVRALARRTRRSLEEAGRDARYAFFVREARRHRMSRVAVGHNRDDQAETVLMRLVRGSSADGLAGIPPTRELARGVALVRPLLGRSRAEIEAFLRRQGERWRTDPTNADQAFLRNRVRHELLPLLERRYNPAVRSALARASLAVSEDGAHLNALAASALARVRRGPALRTAALRRLALPIRRRILWMAAGEAGADLARMTQGHLDALVVLAGQRRKVGGEAHLPGLRARLDGGLIRLVRRR